jgi:hypothetical protein
VIYDLDAGRPERPGRGGVRMTAVTVVALGSPWRTSPRLRSLPASAPAKRRSFTFSAPALPTMARPTFNSRPVPDRRSSFRGRRGQDVPHHLAGPDRAGEQRLHRDDVPLRSTGDLVTVAPLPQSEALPYTSPLDIDPPLRVRGQAAQATVTFGGTSAIRWVENTMVFEMSSRTLTVAQLVELANKLR